MPHQSVIDERDIEPLLTSFYGMVRQDEALGPIFNAAVGDWPEHIQRLSDFWSSVMLTSGRYKGNPVAVHLEHAGHLTPEMFGRWLTLWRTATTSCLSPDGARAMQAKAEKIAESLQLAITYRNPRNRSR